MSQYHQRAFSLAELIVTLSVLGVVSSIATPALSGLIQQNRKTAQVNQMVSLINFARAEAVTRQAMVSLCSGEAACNDTTQWQGQILIFSDPNHNGKLDTGDVLLRTELVAESYRWHWSNFRSQKHLSFKPDGITHSLNGTFTLCQNASPIRSITLNTAGRARLGPASSPNCAK